MKHKQSTSAIFLVSLSLLLVTTSLISMYEESCPPTYSPNKQYCNIEKYFNMNYENRLNNILFSVQLEKSSAPGTIIVGNYLKITKNNYGNNISFKFETTKHSRFYPIQFTLHPKNISKPDEVPLAAGHPIQEQDKYFKRDREESYDFPGPFTNESYQLCFLENRNNNICLISFIENKVYPLHCRQPISHFLLKRIKTQKEIKNAYKNSYIEKNYNNTIPFNNPIPQSKYIPVKKKTYSISKISHDISNKAKTDTHEYFYKLVSNFYHTAIQNNG